MKRNFITRILILISFVFLFAFNGTAPIPDVRISEAFGKKYVDFLLQNNPDLINYYNFYLTKSYLLVEMPNKPTKNQIKELKLKPEFAAIKSTNFNVLLYDIERYFDRKSYYNYKGKLLVMLSEKEFMELYNENRKKQSNQ